MKFCLQLQEPYVALMCKMLPGCQQVGAHLEVRTPSATACMLSTMADNFSPLPILRPTVRLRLRSPAVLRQAPDLTMVVRHHCVT